MRNRPDWLVVHRPGTPVLFLICMAAIIVVGWHGDLNSCLRSNAVRGALHTYFQGQRQRVQLRIAADHGLELQADRLALTAAINAAGQVRPLACHQALPPTR